MPRQAKLVHMIEEYGFDRIQVGLDSRNVWWRQLGDHHITIEPADCHRTAFPDFKQRYARISIYRGPELMEGLEHQETAYIADDLISFLEEYCGDVSEVKQDHDHGD